MLPLAIFLRPGSYYVAQAGFNSWAQGSLLLRLLSIWDYRGASSLLTLDLKQMGDRGTGQGEEILWSLSQPKVTRKVDSSVGPYKALRNLRQFGQVIISEVSILHHKVIKYSLYLPCWNLRFIRGNSHQNIL